MFSSGELRVAREKAKEKEKEKEKEKGRDRWNEKEIVNEAPSPSPRRSSLGKESRSKKNSTGGVNALHSFEESRITFAYCDYCGLFIRNPFGKQGYLCLKCGEKIHKRCLKGANATPCSNNREALQSEERCLQEAHQHLTEGKLGYALDCFTLALKTAPPARSAVLYYQRAIVHEKVGNLHSAFEDIKESRARNKNTIPQAPLTCYYANLLGKQERLTDSKNDSNNKDTMQEALALQNNAITTLLSQKEATTTKDSRQQLSQCYYHKANLLLFHRMQLDDALSALDSAIELTPNWGPLYECQGEILLLRKDYKRAVHAYTLAIKGCPSSAISWNNRGFARRMLDDFSEAIKDLETAIALDPSLKNPYYHRACCLYEMKNFEEALKDIDTALNLDSRYEAASVKRADITVALLMSEDK